MPHNKAQLDTLKETLLIEIEKLRGNHDNVVETLKATAMDIEQAIDDLEERIQDIFDDLDAANEPPTPENAPKA